MKTITITPIKGALDNVPKEHLQAWYEALQTSVKNVGKMCNPQDTAHCCLCVSAQLEGATFDDYSDSSYVDVVYDNATAHHYAPITFEFQDLKIASIDERTLYFDLLNDGFEHDCQLWRLTHPQIAEIIMGREVVLEVEE